MPIKKIIDRLLGPKVIIPPKTRPTPGGSAWLPSELLEPDQEAWADVPQFQIGRPAEVWAQDIVGHEFVKGPGSYAVASGESGDPRMHPLPPHGEGSVFFRNGRKGIVRMIGRDTVLMAFSEGLFHMPKSDMRDPMQQGLRRRPAALEEHVEERSIKVMAGTLQVPPAMLEYANKMLKGFQAEVQRRGLLKEIEEKRGIIARIDQVRNKATKVAKSPALDVYVLSDFESEGRYNYPPARDRLQWRYIVPVDWKPVWVPNPGSETPRYEGIPKAIRIRRFGGYINTSGSKSKDVSEGQLMANGLLDFNAKPNAESYKSFDSVEAFIEFVREDILDFRDNAMSSKMHEQDIKDLEKKIADLGDVDPYIRDSVVPVQGHDDFILGVRVPTDLSGWKYEDQVDANAEIPEHIYLSISTTPDYVTPADDKERANGLWSTAPSNTINVFNALEGHAFDTLRHEIVHATQDWITYARGKAAPDRVYGVPRRTDLTLDRRNTQHETLPHTLRDIEYQPLLQDEIAAYSKQSPYSVPDTPAEWVARRPFFTTLKSRYVHRWRDAVRNFYQATADMFPSSADVDEEESEDIDLDASARQGAVRVRLGVEMKHAMPKPESAEASHSVVVVVPIPEPLASQFPAREHDPTPPHITVVYLLDVPNEKVDVLEQTVAIAAATCGPIEVTLRHGVERLSTPTGEAYHVKGVDAPGLNELHNELAKHLKASGFILSHQQDYVPHATLAKSRGPDEHYMGQAPEGRFTAETIQIWGIERRQEPRSEAPTNVSKPGQDPGQPVPQ